MKKMKELYEAPKLEGLLFASREHLAGEVDFGALMEGGGSGVSANPEIDIDIPL